jgi:hypothetical protein
MSDVQVATKTFTLRIMVFDNECTFLLTNHQKFIDYSWNVSLFLYNTMCGKYVIVLSALLTKFNLGDVQGSEISGTT